MLPPRSSKSVANKNKALEFLQQKALEVLKKKQEEEDLMNSLGLGLNESKSQSRFMRKESRKDIPVKVQDQLANQEEFKSNQKEYLSVQRYNTQ